MVSSSFLIRSKRQLTSDAVYFVVDCAPLAQAAQPGQFVQVGVPGFFLRRPISVCTIDGSTIGLVIAARGEGTGNLLQLEAGDTIDLLGPLGHGFEVADLQAPIALVGGGIGVPPLAALAKKMPQAQAFLGFQTRAQVMLEDAFSHAVVCTDDGSYGVHGLVTQPLEQALRQRKPSLICACGPRPMLQAVAQLAEQYQVPCQVSLEERMACGVGACLVCQCRLIRDGKEFSAHVCKDGPVFSAEEVF